MKQAKRQMAGSGEALPAGAVGSITSTDGNFTITNNVGVVQNVTSFTLSPGVWNVEINCIFRSNTTTATSGWTFAGMVIADANNDTSGADRMSYVYSSAIHLGLAQYMTMFGKRYINATTTKTYYLNTLNVYTANNPSIDYTVKYIRIA